MVKIREGRGYIIIEIFGRRFSWTVEPRYWRNPIIMIFIWIFSPFIFLLFNQLWVITIMVSVNVLAMVILPYALRLVGTGRVDFGPQFYIGLGGYIAAILSKNLGYPTWLTLLLVLLIVSLISFLLSPIVIISRGLYFSLITFILPFILLEVAYWRSDIFGAETGISGVQQFFGSLSPTTAEFYYFYFSLAIVLLYLFIVDRIIRSKYGLLMGVITEDEDVAELYGINTKLIKIVVFILTGPMMAVPGWFLAHYYGSFTGTLYLSLEFLILVFLGAIIGGRGSIYGALIGTYFAIGIRELTRLFLHEYALLALFSIFLLLLFLLPEGLWGLYRKRRYREYTPGMKLR